MPEVRYAKVFDKIPEYKNPSELTVLTGLEKIEADSFPHTATVGIVALVKLEPHFEGTFTLRFPEDTPNYHEILFANPKDKSVWITPKYDAEKPTFRRAGTYYAALSLDGEAIHKTPIEVVQK